MKNFSISFKYEFQSGTGPMDVDRYVRVFSVGIYAEEEDKPEKLIGKLIFKIVYIAEGLEDGYDLFQILDANGYTLNHAFELFDLETEEFKEDILKYYNHDIIGSNICVFERIEILPEYRGHNIAAKATKDVIFHFGSACSLFIIQAYPLQFESEDKMQDKWCKQLNLNNFPMEEKKAFKQLRNYCKSFGFEEIPDYKDLLFYNPALRNEKFDAINLEE